ncbi:bifunctional diaminohydroxyphosphoribosylaminopyrimidine deaminase/5-amino-6-(5-phosphoribosylamino)uracil reductase RibD [Lacinutrix sp. C3R15]|uniref:bifunctional diaminohydroxyphosphoribosylaminopyrimidine deaminase/5-amino-6-(5-phosphoribosylamino)uracil reductase RibD n=1 Tax=Flavobacteriaceae TaxID=49546 RepID=UPI001C0A3E0F|nr:bifunctional diaminohydroxyphosphoribosylaminopyrimidine deaminase/5-amino-6-(5-phosphoribosylamino)uracil reductase RibD [Oceanihabitans sp. 1_MG-2023]MBU2940634.1 bifunctional diaminohydroxyphosphoribosylaminopyrimidine deaminase/5-amino-6-(5-phosphoribosylamino)uracil reductase RibD [Lacinutrix sp. C3R15]MDO6623952.1 bifunctional diaminohydroxyphosphoribosylaminopyrimidine deaminase/5-amino-6-(5-phosphoribosylamino)uracil reductase RibD [Oceanihabitans sp. 1_MG-2023]
MITHKDYIQRCIQIAKLGLGTTRPNPMVGAVIVHNNKVIAEGYTSAYGGNHAEVNAIQAVQNKTLLKEATLYVTLEPCSHFGKTPPCSDLIIKHKIPNVVIGCVDDNPEVAGKGIKKLRDAGCNVTVGVLEEECKEHHKRFFTFHNKKRPYIILKWAETADGFIAPKTKNENKPVWITNEISRQLVHKWRAQEQAILVGANTVIQDNPSLTVRDFTGNNPTRVVLDKNNLLSKAYAVFNNHAETIVLKEKTAKTICQAIYKHDINSIIIEGGAQTLQLFIDENLWDEARIFTGNILFKQGVKAPSFSGKMVSTKTIIADTLKIFINN